MFKTAFLILLLAHILGDYYFQTNKLARQKKESFLSLLKHSFVYLVICLLITIPIYEITIVIAYSFLAVSHFIVDLIKFIYIKNTSKNSEITPEKDRKVYIVDQLIHFIIIAIISFILVVNNYTVTVLPIVRSSFQIIGVSISFVFSWMLALLLIWKPTNITIKTLINLHKPEENTEYSNKVIKAGGFIGLLERLIVLILLSINQYSAIGLVLTAKSIARYDKISKNQNFAEYYLLGTLLSTIFVIVIFLLSI